MQKSPLQYSEIPFQYFIILFIFFFSSLQSLPYKVKNLQSLPYKVYSIPRMNGAWNILAEKVE